MPERPNIIIIMTDQQRADLSRREGFPLDTTPFLDLITARGVSFDRAYTSMPVCAPARVSMLTGRYPSAHRVRTNHNIEDACYELDLFDILRRHGYRTALIGKNHSHLTSENADFWYECGHLGIDDPNRSEQDVMFDQWLKSTHFHLSVDPTPFPVECQIPYRLVSKAQQWIRSDANRPFFLWLSFPEPHNPYQVPEPYYSMFPPDSIPPPRTDDSALECKGFKYQWCRTSFERAFPDYRQHFQRARANYLGMLRLLDDQIHRLVDWLEKENLLGDTLVVFLSDHGDFIGEYGLLRKGPELPEVLVRIPLLFLGPGIRPSPSRHHAHVSIVDVMPTLLEAAGIDIPIGVQGRSLWPIISGDQYPESEFRSAYAEHGFGGLHYDPEDCLDPTLDGFTPAEDGRWGAFDCLNSRTQSGFLRMVRKDNWKLTFDMQGVGCLYDLAADPSEMVNLYDQPGLSDIRQELLEELLTWQIRVGDPLPLPRRRYVVKRDRRNYWQRSHDG